jgi:hypothetical protein
MAEVFLFADRIVELYIIELVHDKAARVPTRALQVI